ncbi:MAG: class I SAM-dependent methyltransferase [Ignavibacteriales bacterium]|nr:class I SAM-dependent methyltransferase [Ignavibacteriales bacterium]
MKVIDSGMPDEIYWNSLFNISHIVHWLDLENITGPIVEIGCGYGTFTVPVAKKTHAQVIAFDIEPNMLETARHNVQQSGLFNVQFSLRDVLEMGTGLDSESVGMILLFNILHFNERRLLLEEASRILKQSGVAAILHWRKDIKTPRGPIVHLRPDQETILGSIGGLDLHFHGNSRFFEPYHWGMQLIKGINN